MPSAAELWSTFTAQEKTGKQPQIRVLSTFPGQDVQWRPWEKKPTKNTVSCSIVELHRLQSHVVVQQLHKMFFCVEDKDKTRRGRGPDQVRG